MKLKNVDLVLCQTCNCIINRSSIYAHQRSDKHVNNLVKNHLLQGGSL